MARVSTTTKILVMADVHAPLQDESALKVVEEFRADFKPHIVIALGDWLDATSVSSFAYDSLAETDLLHEFEVCNQLLDRFRPDYYLEGNHEERLRRAGLVKQDHRSFFDPQRNLYIRQRGIKWIPYVNDKVLYLGKLGFHHGITCGVNATRGEAMSNGNIVCGHIHRSGLSTIYHAGAVHTAHHIACLCNLQLEYAKSKKKQPTEHGFGWGYIYKSGHFTFNIARLLGSEVHLNDKRYKIGWKKAGKTT